MAVLYSLFWVHPLKASSLWSESRRWPGGQIEGVRGKITNQSTSGSDPCNPSYIDIPQLSNSCSLSVGMFISCPMHFWSFFSPPCPTHRFVCLPQSPTPSEAPASSSFRCFLLCFHISLSAPTPQVSSSSQHKLVLLSLPLIPSSIPTIPSYFLLGAISLAPSFCTFCRFYRAKLVFVPFQTFPCNHFILSINSTHVHTSCLYPQSNVSARSTTTTWFWLTLPGLCKPWKI